jgi:hypothetical protein
MKFFCLLSALVLGFLVASTTALATTMPLPIGMTAVPLAAITNDRDSSVSNMGLMLDAQNTVRGIYLKTRANKHTAPAKSTGRVYWLSRIESPKGVVLGQGKGVKAILLQGNIEPHGGHGSLVIKYLTNGLFRHYAQCRVDLRRLGPDNWQLVNAYDGAPIQHIQVKTWALGISNLVNVCPAHAG